MLSVSESPAFGEGISASAALDLFLDSDVDSLNTRATYRRQILGSLASMGVTTVEELTAPRLAALRALVMRSAAAPSTKAVRISSLRSYLRWLAAMGAPVPPFALVEHLLRTPRSVTVTPLRVVPDGHFAELLAHAETAQERAILATLGGAGLRAGEVGALDVRDFEGAALTVRYGKGMRGRTVPIRPDVAVLIRQHLATHPLAHTPRAPLFLWGAQEERFKRCRLNQLLRRICRRALPQCRPYTAHCFRHMYAMRAMAMHHDIVAVGKLLGHANLRSTKVYLDHLTLGDLLDNVPALPVLAAPA